jgi:sodium transport system permease protein
LNPASPRPPSSTRGHEISAGRQRFTIGWGDVRTVLRKELRETLRDRRTLAVMILFPLVVYPLVSLVMAEVMAGKQSEQEARRSRVVVWGPPSSSARTAAVRTLLAKNRGIELVDSSPREPAAPGSPEPLSFAEARRELQEKRFDALVELPVDVSAAVGIPARVLFDETHEASEKALSRIEGALGAQLPPGCARTYAVTSISVAPRSQVGGYILSKILPLIVVVMTMLGAFYPAIDITAGERERGTLETLLSSPVRRFDLMLGKVLAVTVLATLTGILNITSMSMTVAEGARMAGGAAAQSLTIPWTRAATTILTVLPAAFLWGSIMVAVGALARTFKEAQNLLTPVYFLCFAPALIAGLGDFPLTGIAIWIPGTNLTLLARDLMLGEATFGHIALVTLVTLLFGSLALSFAARMYDSERLLASTDADHLGLRAWLAHLVLGRSSPAMASSRAGAWGEAPSPQRAPAAAQPTASHAIALFAVAFVLWFFAFSWAQRWRLIPGLLISQWGGFLGLVFVYARFMHMRFRDVLMFRRPAMSALLGAVLLGASAWVILGIVADKLVPPPHELIESMRKLIRPPDGHRGFSMSLFALALTPAICEEALFRGAILRGLRQRFGVQASCALTGVLFGILHGDVWRLLPTTLLGTLLSWVALTTGSIVPAMVIHAINNGSLVTLGYFGWDQAAERLPAWVEVLTLFGAALMFAAGLVLIGRNRKPLRR